MPVDYVADLVVFAEITPEELGVLLIQRADDSDAYPGCWALPGGYVEEDETSRQAAVRETREESGITVPGFRVSALGVYDNPRRDPRGRVVSSAFWAWWQPVDGPFRPVAASDAKTAELVPVSRVRSQALAFDHFRIVRDAACVIERDSLLY